MNDPAPAVAGIKLTVSQVCRSIPGTRGNPRVSPSTVARWILKGCPALDGRRVKLAAVRAGSRWLIDPAALDAFFKALATVGPTALPPDVPESRTDSRRKEAIARAARELERRGA